MKSAVDRIVRLLRWYDEPWFIRGHNIVTMCTATAMRETVANKKLGMRSETTIMGTRRYLAANRDKMVAEKETRVSVAG